ncbi:L,D-transpeptidase family protein [Bradyrhizobium pachyrhizi]|uniref:L,D-transpeptidase family protein n=2 Tax=Bradyrhizobium pachyrhizi TaxID=280333 RepID=A0A844SNM8_9BRAD|nr:L,D-transpeptidase family protein [Bradyrhizobium pachyrhizi]
MRVGPASHHHDAHPVQGQHMTQQSVSSRRLASRAAHTLAFASVLFATPFVVTTSASAQVRSSALGYASTQPGAFPADEVMNDPSAGVAEDGALPERLRRTTVALNTTEAPGTIIIDTGNTALYYVLGGGRAIRYGVGVGREGFTWAGTQTISRKAEWPDWHPPAEMIKRQPYLPRFMAGGPGNPLGARAMYLGSSEYRIHGTNDPSTIGKFVSSGCIRLTNEDVSDLFSRVDVGTRVVVLPKNAPHLAAREIGPTTTQISVRPAAARPRPAAATLPSGRQAMNIPTASSLY